jgi:four helix bundle protein
MCWFSATILSIEKVMGKGFRELQVRQRSKDLAVYIYKVTNENVFSRDYGLRDQIRRVAVSVASNIAEGDERDTNKDSVRFLYMQKVHLQK